MTGAIGLSLGTTHYLLKIMLAKGWVKAQTFRRHFHKMVYLHILTNSAMRERMLLVQAFLYAMSDNS